MGSQFQVMRGLEGFNRYENYKEPESSFGTEVFRQIQNLEGKSRSGTVYELKPSLLKSKASTLEDSSTSPTVRRARRPSFQSATKRHQTSARTSPLITYTKKIKHDRLSSNCSSPLQLEHSNLELPKCCLSETICNDSDCQLPPCNEPHCGWNDVIVCVDGNNCGVSTTCKKDCFSLQTTRMNSPPGEWSPSDLTQTNNFTPRQLYTNSLSPYLNTSTSPSPATPLLSTHPSTIFSQPDIPTPSRPFSPLNTYKDQTDVQLSNLDAGFPKDTSTGNIIEQPWPNTGQLPQSADKFYVFQCPWLDCSRIIENGEQWNQHFHQEHIDPQMVYNCPIQETCSETLITNPLAHLQTDHGINFNHNGNEFRCPSKTCQQGIEPFDPPSFHNHLDHYHATPGSGHLRCQLWACDDRFDDLDDLMSHAMQDHTIPVWSKPDSRNYVGSTLDEIQRDTHSQMNQGSEDAGNDIIASRPEEDLESVLPLPSQKDNCSSSLYATSKPMLEPEKKVIQCQWNDTQGTNCGMLFDSEIDLHYHIKETHLEFLDNKTGYYCRWNGCTRETKLGSKSGFSQRGKLERHMATHTNFKCSMCDICGSSFSAPQAMKQHRRLHTGERPWKCKHCGKLFTQQSACTVHERTHTNEKPLECPICFKKFSESSNLTKHRRTHGEKGAHACPFPKCGKTFHRFDQLKRHLNAHDKNKNSMASSKNLEC